MTQRQRREDDVARLLDASIATIVEARRIPLPLALLTRGPGSDDA